MKQNAWEGGRVAWQAPPLPPELKGAMGARFHKGVFSEKVGPETFLAILDPMATEEYPPLTWPSQLGVTTGVARTSHGPVAFAIWSVRRAGERLVTYEHLLNPLAPGAVSLVQGVADQSHLKVVLINSATDETAQVGQFENSFDLAKLATAMQIAGEGQPGGDWRAAQEEYKHDFPLESLLSDECP